jgi:hypothetical protein
MREQMAKTRGGLLKWLDKNSHKNGSGIITESQLDLFLRDVYSQPSDSATCYKIEINFEVEAYGPVQYLDKEGHVLAWSSLEFLYQRLKIGLQPKKGEENGG